MSAPTEETIIIAEVGAAHGLHGAVKLRLFSQELDGLKKAKNLLRQDQPPLSIKSARRGKNDSEAIVIFHEIPDRTAAESLRGTTLSVFRDTLPETDEDEYYHTDLIGMQICDSVTDKMLGTVISMHNFGAGDIVEFRLENGKSLMHPFDQNFIQDFDVEAKIITITGFDQSDVSG